MDKFSVGKEVMGYKYKATQRLQILKNNIRVRKEKQNGF